MGATSCILQQVSIRNARHFWPQDVDPGLPINAGQRREGQLLACASAVIERVEVSLFPQLGTHHVQEVIGKSRGHGEK